MAAGIYARCVEAGAQVCRVCRRATARLTFEHVPPRAAFNSERTHVYGLEHWLQRGENGQLEGGRIEQRGAGDFTLCEDCNNRTGSWYGNELGRAARSAAGILRQLPLEELDANLEYTWADVGFRQSQTGPYPLRLIKQILTMLLATIDVLYPTGAVVRLGVRLGFGECLFAVLLGRAAFSASSTYGANP